MSLSVCVSVCVSLCVPVCLLVPGPHQTSQWIEHALSAVLPVLVVCSCMSQQAPFAAATHSHSHSETVMCVCSQCLCVCHCHCRCRYHDTPHQAAESVCAHIHHQKCPLHHILHILHHLRLHYCVCESLALERFPSVCTQSQASFGRPHCLHTVQPPPHIVPNHRVCAHTSSSSCHQLTQSAHMAAALHRDRDVVVVVGVCAHTRTGPRRCVYVVVVVVSRDRDVCP